jgi:hypothetical protein
MKRSARRHSATRTSPILLPVDRTLFDAIIDTAKTVLKEARGMGGANGSRECAPDEKLRDTH